MQLQQAIELRNVSKDYRIGHTKQTVLRGVNLVINIGDFVSIVGPSGSGKTTLAHIIGGLTTPSSGEVLVGGQNLGRLRDPKLSGYRNKQVGFVFQNFGLLPHYTALENVALPLVLAKMSPHERAQMAERCLQSVGLGKRLRSRANQLSGGERQRVAIARAIVGDPDIIIADEPTGSLDSKQGEEIANLLQKLHHERGITLLLVTHNPQLAARADHILHLLDGTVNGVRHAVI